MTWIQTIIISEKPNNGIIDYTQTHFVMMQCFDVE